MMFPPQKQTNLQWTEHNLHCRRLDYMKIEEPEHLPFVQPPDSKWIGWGVSGVIFVLNKSFVLKEVHYGPFYEDSAEELTHERKIYERLGDHPRVLKLICPCQNGLIFERMVDSLSAYIRMPKYGPYQPIAQQSLNWCIQAAEAISYIHSKNIRQSDISGANFLIDFNENIKICDFGGSQIDGGTFCHGPGAPMDGPKHPNCDPTNDDGKGEDGYIPIERELFALGSVMYEIWTSRYPYEGEVSKTDTKTYKMLYGERRFPADVSDLPVGSIILGCWHSEFTSADKVVAALKLITLPTTTTERRLKTLECKERTQEVLAQQPKTRKIFPLSSETSAALPVILATAAIVVFFTYRAFTQELRH